ncbi:MAG: NADH-quinone oxidoreductase subunit N [Acidimicrobiia bacterium]
MTSLLALSGNPHVDYHALAPELILAATIVVGLLVECFARGRAAGQMVAKISAIGVLAAIVPLVTLGFNGKDRSLFDGRFVLDNYAIAFKALFLGAAFITILLSFDDVEEGDNYKGEYYVLLLTSVLGMVAMASARDLVTIFVALETISIPTFVLAGWRKHERKSNEAAIKYYLIGVISSAVMMYGMSFIYGMTGSTLLTEISAKIHSGAKPLLAVGIVLTLVGFAFKISAVPFHFWAPDTYEGAPTPVTAFLSVASKAGGFVALVSTVGIGFIGDGKFGPDIWYPLLWVLAALSMTLGNLTALRQSNIVRMLAYSSIAQGGFILASVAVMAKAGASSLQSVLIYLLVYAAMNLGLFGVVIAVARSTRSGEVSSFAGLGRRAPVLAVLASAFLFSLAGIPPLGGWFAKFTMFRAVVEAGGGWNYALAGIAAVNSVIAFFYYAAVARQMWFHEADPEAPRVSVRPPIRVALALCAATTLVIGVYPQVFGKAGQLITSEQPGHVSAAQTP